MGKQFWLVAFLLSCFSLKAASQLRWQPLPDTLPSAKLLTILPQNFYNQHTGFFCVQEVQLQKYTRLPVYVRLGDKAYVDYLEGKPNAKAYR